MGLYGDIPAPKKGGVQLSVETENSNKLKETNFKNNNPSDENLAENTKLLSSKGLGSMKPAFMPMALKRKPPLQPKKLKATTYIGPSILNNTNLKESDPLETNDNKTNDVNLKDKESLIQTIDSNDKEKEDYEVYDPKIPNDYEFMVQLKIQLKRKINPNLTPEQDLYLSDNEKDLKQIQTFEIKDETNLSPILKPNTTSTQPSKQPLNLTGEEAYLRRLQLSGISIDNTTLDSTTETTNTIETNQFNTILHIQNLPKHIEQLKEAMALETTKFGTVLQVVQRSDFDFKKENEFEEVFVEFEDGDDAEMAYYALDQRLFAGKTIQVQLISKSDLEKIMNSN